MRKFMLITNAYKDKSLALSEQIVRYISERGGTAAICVSCAEEGVVRDFALGSIPEDTECILVLGGDGTLIRAATKVQSMQIPLIGVNLGRLGYLCELEGTTVFSAIDKLMADEYITEERIMLCGGKSIGDPTRLALNDIAIHWSGDLSMLELMVYVNGEFLTTYHADGLVMATPTGSTGYSMSAGGPIMDPRSRMFVLTPINAHNLNSQSIVLGGEDVVEIEMRSRGYQRAQRAGVSFDGDLGLYLTAGERVEIKRAANIVKICKLSNRSFLEILSKKMRAKGDL